MSSPWLSKAWKQLSHQLSEDNFPQSLLLRGEKGLGKLQLAKFVAKTILCSEQKHQACNHCHSCQLVDSGAHGSLFLLEQEKPKVDDIRALSLWANQTSSFGSSKVAIISDIGALNTASNNALLKTLEEPVADTHFILVNHLPFKAMPTIMSRCQVLNIATPEQSWVKQWLVKQKLKVDENFALIYRFCNGSPLQIKEFYREQQFTQLEQFIHQYQLMVQAKTNKLADLVHKQPLYLQWLGHCLTLSFSLAKGLANRDDFPQFAVVSTKDKTIELAYQDWLDLLKQIEEYPGLNVGQQLYPLFTRFKD
ncbi:DNA polymerase III delta prime subunit [Agarivorans albus]|uniref:DNA-directed DNA polymerase n=1 Tax=Agarivorans albus MKT 106 TaxID=1331007 RepID=R9PQ94_AGAAL|nr:DNA polymerase III delta prime subunit [Agarivorans albus]GAD03567.1 DNA polymerase III delta prime subunit [Agarivorans albus MKT 106]